MPQTRSQTRYALSYLQGQLYNVVIDFDEASRSWKANKKSIGNGSYKYICQGRLKTGSTCKREAKPGTEFCSWHK